VSLRPPNGQTHATSRGHAPPIYAHGGRAAFHGGQGAPRRASAHRAFVYIHAMAVMAHTVRPGVALLLGWRRVLLALGVSVVFGALNTLPATASPIHVTIAHAVVVGLTVVLAFGLLEHYPARLPTWLPRWILQLVGVVVAVPAGVLLAHFVHMAIDEHAAHEPGQMTGLITLIVEGLLFAPWIALGAMVRQRDVLARDQALAFALERSQLERNALETRLRLLQAQVEPHFLFNTLANVQELVDARSPQAANVLASLIAYLRAAVPRIHEPATTLGQELELVRAYLELMRMRMPDRLEFALHVDPAVNGLECPPMTVLTLVENAVRHGIDPSEEGGRVDVEARATDGRCSISVTDTGLGLAAAGGGLGTGLSTLRERLQLAFGHAAQLHVAEIEPHGVCARLDIPALRKKTP
jgi:signal transduction histidine kinase